MTEGLNAADTLAIIREWRDEARREREENREEHKAITDAIQKLYDDLNRDYVRIELFKLRCDQLERTFLSAIGDQKDITDIHTQEIKDLTGQMKYWAGGGAAVGFMGGVILKFFF